MATHSSTLAWRIPGTGEAGRLPFMGSHRVGHDWSDLAAPVAAAAAALVTLLYSFTEKNYFILLAINSLKCNGFVSQEIFKSKFPKTHKKCTHNLKLHLKCIKNVLCHIFIVLFPQPSIFSSTDTVSPYFHFFNASLIRWFFNEWAISVNVVVQCLLWKENIVVFFP